MYFAAGSYLAPLSERRLRRNSRGEDHDWLVDATRVFQVLLLVEVGHDTNEACGRFHVVAFAHIHTLSPIPSTSL